MYDTLDPTSTVSDWSRVAIGSATPVPSGPPPTTGSARGAVSGRRFHAPGLFLGGIISFQDTGGTLQDGLADPCRIADMAWGALLVGIAWLAVHRLTIGRSNQKTGRD